MAKRKLKTSDKSKGKRKKIAKKKTSLLPEVSLEDDLESTSFAEISNSSLLDNSVLVCEDCSSDESDNDCDLPEGLSSLPTPDAPLQKGDLVWIKDNSHIYYWPAFVKEVEKKHIKVLFLLYNKFEKGERAFKYNSSSVKVKRFNAKNNATLINQGKEFNRKYDTKLGQSGSESSSLTTFCKAVDLAQTYAHEKLNQSFDSDGEILRFFATDGLSLCQKKCIAEHNTVSIQSSTTNTDLAEPPDDDLSIDSNPDRIVSEQKTVVIPSSTTDLNVSEITDVDSTTATNSESVVAEITDVDSISETTTESVVAEITDVDSIGETTTDSVVAEIKPSNVKEVVEISSDSASEIDDCPSPFLKKIKWGKTQEKRYRIVLNAFNNKNKEIVSYIVGGHCCQRLMEIFNKKIPSKRMELFFQKWHTSASPSKVNCCSDDIYFEDQAHLKETCNFLHTFIVDKIKSISGIVRQKDLLFGVFLPEAIIFSISQLRRRKMSDAEKLFKQGCKMRRITSNPLLCSPLTSEERLKVKRRLESFMKKEFNLSEIKL